MHKCLILVMLLLTAAAHAAPVMVVDSQPEYWLPLDAEGWTVLPENTDPSAVTIYVSSSEGDNGNDGLSAEEPVATLEYARSLCRNGTISFTQQPGYTGVWADYVSGATTVADTITWFSDTLLLKCGDTWDENLILTMGESGENPFVAASYGTGARPVVNEISRSASDNNIWGRFAVIGIEFTGMVSVNGTQYTDRGYDKPAYMLLENCIIRGATFYVGDNVALRRCIVVDNYSTTSHAQGLFAYDSDSLMVEDCVFDHNGWHDTIEDAEPTIFNHNMYIKESCLDFILRNTISARASAAGAQLRAGGDCINNLFLENPTTLNWGYVTGSPITPGGVTGEITNNVVLGDADICRPRPTCTDLPRGRGFAIANVASGTCTGNILSTRITDPVNNEGIGLYSDLSDNNISNLEEAGNIGINGFTLQNNIVYGWDGALALFGDIWDSVSVSENDVQDAAATLSVAVETLTSWSGLTLTGNRYYAGGSDLWNVNGTNTTFANWVSATGETGSNEQVMYTDPTRSIATYMASLGYSAGDQTVEKFLELARANSKANWDVRFTADAVNDYIRAGFTE